jgi:hypothetical protein
MAIKHYFKLVASFAMSAGCGSCNSTSTIDDFPAFTQGVNQGLNYRRGGITGLAFNKCNSPFTDVTDQAEWQAKIDGTPAAPPNPAIPPSLVVLMNCFVGFEKTSETQTVTVGACQTILRTGSNKTITGTVTADNSNYDVFKLMQHLQTHPADYQVAIIGCDGEVYPFKKMTIQADHNIEGTIEGSTNWTLTLTYNTVQDDLPLTLTWQPSDLNI